jgi:hypothetical protein
MKTRWKTGLGVLVGALLLSSGAALAANCAKQCKEEIKQCETMCKKYAKDGTNKCLAACKDEEKTCVKECKSNGKDEE